MSHGAKVETDAKGPGNEEDGLPAAVTRFMFLVNEWIMGVATIAVLGASCVLTVGVVLRYFLKLPTDWQDETAVFLIVGAIFMCGAYVQSFRGHIGIEALASVLPEAVNRIRRLFVDIASFAFCCFFAWKSWTLLYEAVHEGQTTSSSFAPPLWIPYGLMATGMTLLSLQILLQILTHCLQKREAK